MIVSAEEFYRLRMSNNSDEYNRSAHDSASEEVWLDVIHEYPDMKTWVIHNKTVPIAILERLADDKDENIRRDVASKRKLTRELFQKILKDESEKVRFQLTFNKKLPLDMLETLAEDESKFVRNGALENLIKRKK